jgi:DNA-binding NtrC family response regulator
MGSMEQQKPASDIRRKLSARRLKMQIEHTRDDKFAINTEATDSQKLLLIGNDKNKDIALSIALTREGYHVVYCDSVKNAWQLVYPQRPDVIILRLGKADASGLADLQECRVLAEGVPIVLIIDGHVNNPAVMSALHHGAAVVLPELSTPDRLRQALDSLHASTA